MSMLGGRMINLKMNIDEAEKLSLNLSDILCWVCGFKAGAGESQYLPFEIEDLRKLNVRLIDEIRYTKQYPAE